MIKGDIVVRGGTVVTDSWSGPATVVISGDRISGVLDGAAEVDAARTVDATGMLVLPGGVDAHCHVGLPLGAYTTRDTFSSATIGALAGGTTTIVDFAIPGPGEDPLAVLRRRLAEAETSRCDYAMHGCISSPDGSIPATVHAFAEAGVRTVKLFTTYRDLLMVDLPTVRQVMTACAFG
jgi:dihydropyrimidinase